MEIKVMQKNALLPRLLLFLGCLLLAGLLVSCGNSTSSTAPPSLPKQTFAQSAASTASQEQVQKAFIAYYGRPADSGGLNYWAGRLDAVGGNWSEIIEAFGNSAEATALLAGLTNEQKIDKLYNQMFARNADSAGRTYYATGLTNGSFTLASLAVNIVNGATGSDATTVANKLTSAQLVTASLVTPSQIASYSTASVAAVRNWLSIITSTAASQSSVDTLVSSMSSPSVTIVFDYTYDTNGFFTPERRALMQKAAEALTSRMRGTRWARVDTTATGGHYDLAFIHPTSLAISWNSDVVIPENQITVYVGATHWNNSPFTPSTGDATTQLMSIRTVSGGIGDVLTNATQYRPINASITFDLQGIQGFSSSITRQWHFDSDGNLNTDDRNPTDPHYYDYTDFYTAAIHELGHVLGIHNPNQVAFDSSFSLESDPNYESAYLGKVQPDGMGGYVFTGSHAKQFYYNHVGQNIPLDATKCHWADGVRSVTAAGSTSITHESNQPFRVGFSELEFGVLQDIGYTISSN